MFLRDLRFAVRTLARNPGFTILAILTLALGIGVNTGIFSVVNAVLLRPLPYRDPDRIVAVWETYQTSQGSGYGSLCPRRFRAWRQQNRVFDGIALYQPRAYILQEADTSRRINGLEACADFFSILGVEPLLGRTFAPDEDQPGRDHVAVISADLWNARFGGDRNLVGKSISLEGGKYTVIGIMPSGFHFPFGSATQIWTPFSLPPGPDEGHETHSFKAIARIKPSLGIEQARSQMDTLTLNLESNVDPKSRRGVLVNSLLTDYVGWVEPVLFTLSGAVACVLLIASANVSNLLLARALGRRTEVAIRAALGAGRGRITVQLFSESMILAVAGAALGLALGAWTVRLVQLTPYNIPRLKDVTLDGWMLAICAAISVIAVLLFGLLPAFQASRTDLQQVLRDSGRGITSRMGLRSVLVAGEVALTMVLLIGAGLMLRSLLRLQSVNTGFRTEHLLTMRLPLPVSRYPDNEAVARFYRQVVEQVSGLPSLRAVGMISRLPPIDSGTNSSFQIDGRAPVAEADRPFAELRWVTPGYFTAMGIPLLRGRMLTEQDAQGAPFAVLVNEALARRYFPNENPVGARLDRKATIVGVVGDVKNAGLSRPTLPEMYYSYLQYPSSFRVDAMYLVAGATLQPAAMAAAIRAEIQKLDPLQTVVAVQTMQQVLDNGTTQPRFQAAAIGIFAAMALLISMVGLYGVVSYAVAQRTHEIGVRMALGASRRRVMLMVLWQALRLGAAGIVLGVAGSLVVTRIVESFLFETSPTDPATFAGISSIVVLVILVAVSIPARRATRVDPMIALRYE